MAKLWQLVLLCWTWSRLCVSSPVSFAGSSECEKYDFVPGYNLGGEGFDIVKMERKGASVIDTETWKIGNGTCRLFRNRYMNNTIQKVPAAVWDWRVLQRCSLKVDSVVYNSAEALISECSSAVASSWKTGLNLTADPKAKIGKVYGGSQSKECTFAMQKAKKDRYTFLHHSVSCTFYRYRLKAKPPLSQEFESAVKSLPSYSNKTVASYQDLIDTYGTHYTTLVTLGGVMKAVTAVRTCEATMNGQSMTDICDCLTVEASASFAHPESIKSMMQYCNKKKKKMSISSFSGLFNERSTVVTGGHVSQADILFQGQSDPSVYIKWINSLKTVPDGVQYNLKPLHTILPAAHPATAGLKREVERYIRKNALWKKCSESCQIGHRSNPRDPCACVCNSNPNVHSNCCPTGRGLATLRVFGLHAKGLYGDRWTQTDGSVVVSYGKQVRRTAIIRNNDNPKWSQSFEFGPIDLKAKKNLNFSVYDEDTYWNSDLLGRCSFNLHSGNVTDSCMFTHGTFFFSYQVVCAPNLGGGQCQDYVPTPVSPLLSEVFHQKNWAVLESQGQTMFGHKEKF